MKEVVLCFGALFACAIGLVATNSSSPQVPAWEYKIVSGFELAGVDSVWEFLETEPKSSTEKDAKQLPEAKGDKPDLLSGLVQFESGIASNANKRIAKGMNKLGEAGWELVDISSEPSIVERSYAFKRQKP